MIFKRKIYQQLLKWKKESNGEKALLIEGARRIGKSTIAEEFARNEFRSYIFIDFNTASDATKAAFNNYINDLDTFFLILSTEYNVKLYEKESLIIFDEVQKFPKAREAVKYLVADGRYFYLETGSLISIKENVSGITLPSEERKIRMYPMDFEEFGWACGETQMMEYIKACYKKQVELESNLHSKAMFLFRQYIIVGGMPKPVSTYLESGKDFEKVDEEKRDILNLYREDIMKIKGTDRSKVLAIFDQIPAFLSKSERRVMLSKIEKNATFPKYHDTFFWLADAMIVNECFNCWDPNVGLSLNEDRSYVKCYLCDTGLLISSAFNENEVSDGELYREILYGKLSTNEGMFYENVVAQMLVAGGHKLFFYVRYNPVKHRNDIEVDFLLSNNSKLKYKIFPVEVKSTNRYSLISLERFDGSFKERIGGNYVIHTKNFKKEGNITFIPVYMTMCL